MSRRARITPNIHLHTTLPADVSTRLSLLLFSEVEGCVPRGKVQELITRLLRQYFEDKEVNLEGYIRQPVPQPLLVRGSVHTLSTLINHLNLVAGNVKGSSDDTRVTSEDSLLASEGRERHPDRGGDDPGNGSAPGGQDDSSSIIPLVQEPGAEGHPDGEVSPR